MGKSKVIGFDAAKLEKDMMDYCVDVQTKELITYAEDKCKEIGSKILSYNRANHLDRSGNLLNSLCWGVTYNNELKGSGFYREPVTRTVTVGRGRYKSERTLVAALHEFSAWGKELVNGRGLAEEFLQGSVPRGKNKWKVFFAILAPYWGYWESGFKMQNGMFLKFAIMTQTYDEVKKELKKPSEMHLTITRDMFYTFNKEGDAIKGRYKLNKLGR